MALAIGYVLTLPRYEAWKAKDFYTPQIIALETERDLQMRTWSRALSSWESSHKPDWFENGPGFGRGAHGLGGSADLSLEYWASRTTSPVFVYVMGGTDVRKVGLPGYKSRTKKGVLRTAPGKKPATVVRGGIRDGISARDWHKEIAKRREKPFLNRMQRAVATGANRVTRRGGSIRVKVIL